MKASDAGYSQLTIPQPFASASGAALTPISNTANSETPSFPDGFPAAFSSPSSDVNAKFILRGMMNAIGNLASKNEWYRQAGGIYTFNTSWATANGGYPNGAILDYLKDGHYYKVMSLKDDNMVDFADVGVDGINWMYLNIDTTIDYSKLTVCDVPNFSWPYADSINTQSSTVALSDLFPIGLFTAPRNGLLTVIGACDFTVTGIKWQTATTPPEEYIRYNYTGFAILASSHQTTSGIIDNPAEYKADMIFARGDYQDLFGSGGSSVSYNHEEQQALPVTAGTKYQIYVANQCANVTNSTMKVVLL